MQINQNNTTPRIMLLVSLTLVPAVLYKIIIYSWFGLFSFCCTVTSCLIFEIILSKILKSPAKINDFSALLTALLLFLALNSNSPYFVYLSASLSAIGLAKLSYGGLGHNLFNPAMIGWCFVMLSFPQYMTKHYDFNKSITFNQAQHVFLNNNVIDSYSSATPLSQFKSLLYSPQKIEKTAGQNLAQKNTKLIILNVLILAGGLLLLALRIISSIFPIFLISGSLSAIAILNYNFVDSSILYLLTGPFILASFYIITDPVTSPNLKTAQAIYAFIIGFLAIIIARLGSYPIGMAFAVIFNNAFVPIYDKICLRIRQW